VKSKKKIYKIGIIGCGGIGSKRSKSLGQNGMLVACADIDISRAENVAKDSKAKTFKNWQEVINLDEIDIVIISTTHDKLSDIAIESINSNKHVLIEKPSGKTSFEIKKIIDASKETDVKVRVGFNHRYHPSIIKAKEIIESGALGELMFLRARYGHGGRVGYDKEWRAKPEISGGGELIDQGSHLIDLSRMFLGDFDEVNGLAHTFYWDMPVDDNAFMLLRTNKKQVAFLHASCTEWKNLFSMEIYGRDGKLDINGLGGSYGIENLTHYRMLPEMGPPIKNNWEYKSDVSWANEINEFYEDIYLDRRPAVGLNDAFESIKIVEKIYKESGYDYIS
tara:strand:+ start:115 stop:1122 length:1008 start_codon:yes stop_codon:yes gene_type:complete